MISILIITSFVLGMAFSTIRISLMMSENSGWNSYDLIMLVLVTLLIAFFVAPNQALVP